ncbi:PDZ domain-containing protein [Bacillus benzoevorans]|uniref:endopeptidase La n=2 Tax=Bacillus benzoevorans TaxID=1456 RepID=A0A7X0LTB0_9BACI|nr:PDZ domain-containing protein [Bacillus benzoevorans]
MAILLALSFYSLPYYVSRPGMAKELEPIIKVDGGHDEEGSFMLTTVRMGKANVYSYAIAKWSKYQKIYPVAEIRSDNETDEEYNVRQLHLMDASKLAAIEVAYKKAGKPVNYEYAGVYVLNVIPKMPAEGKLKPGDRIFQVDDHEFTSSKEFLDYVSEKKAGDTIALTYERNDEIHDTKITLEKFKDAENIGRVGVGIGLVEDKKIRVKPEVTVKTDEIGGPSAGFMFSLEIYNQLTEDDLTKGYEIAGTGTISPDGTIGRIGGIEQKIVAADKAGAEIFLAPNEKGNKDSNYLAAVKTAKEIGTDMKIIPIDHFDDAVEYLGKLKEKK